MHNNSSSNSHPAGYWHLLEDGRIQCDLCPRLCQLREGQRGLCFVRARENDRMVLTTYGRSSGFCIDPIEKKPLHHFLPGTSVLSFGTAGCNLACRFCQNWDISKSRQMDTLAGEAEPRAIAAAAAAHGCRSVAYTYNDPVIFLEYANDTADACHDQGISSVAVTAGYISSPAMQDFFSHMDAANVDLKAFSDKFYHKLCGGHLQPVLETLEYLHRETAVWLEITTLLIPGENDSEAELHALTEWVASHLGNDVPLHFSAFHPDWKMRQKPATTLSTLQLARQIAMDKGLHFVYTGNVHDTRGDTTWCPQCGAALIERDWYELSGWHVDADAACNSCGYHLPGVIEVRPGGWGSRRQPISIPPISIPPGPGAG